MPSTHETTTMSPLPPPIPANAEKSLEGFKQIIHRTASRLEGQESSYLCELRVEYMLMARALGLLPNETPLAPSVGEPHAL